MNACIVLAGGAGRRMDGQDKAVLQVGGATMLDRVLLAASPLCRTLVVVGPRRPTTVPETLFIREERPGGGPVPAVLAGLALVVTAELVFLLAADLPLLSTGGLEELVAALVHSGGGTGAAAAADGEGNPNPLLAVYRIDALQRAASKLSDAAGGAPAALLLPEATVTVELRSPETLNVNTPGDLARARKSAGADPGRAV